ncbi:unnamed protein product [Gordionus sp. m RMFG-2023]
MKPFPFTFPINAIIHVDASSTHIGIADGVEDRFSFTFEEAKHALEIPDQTTHHINQKELLAIWVGCKYALNKYGTIPALVTDSQVAYTIIKKGGSRSPACEFLVTKIMLAIGFLNFVHLARNLTWIASEENLADQPSRSWTGNEEAHNVLHDINVEGLPPIDQAFPFMRASTPIRLDEEIDGQPFAFPEVSNIEALEQDFDPAMFEDTLNLTDTDETIASSVLLANEEQRTFGPEEH